LRLGQPADFRFFHSAALAAFLKKAWNVEKTLPEGVVPYAVESGRVNYSDGDLYNFGLTFRGCDSKQVCENIDCLKIAVEDNYSSFRGPLGNDLSFHRVENILTGTEVRHANDLIPLTLDDLVAPIAALADLENWTLRFISPLRMETNLYKAGHRFFDEKFFDLARFRSSLFQRAASLFGADDLEPPATEPTWEIAENNLLWVEAPLREILLGGCCGELRIKGRPGAWAPWLVLGQYLHVGKNTRFGFGAMRIPEIAAMSPFVQRAQDLRRASFALPNVRHACRETARDLLDEGRESPPLPEPERIVEQYLDGRRPAEPLLGVIMKRNGGQRALAIPSLTDRIAQRAVKQILAPSLDQLLEDCSFAYRRGLSRVGAQQAVRAAYRQGYRWALKADIESFFDEIDWRRLENKLIALYADDPLVDLLLDWVKRPVLWQGKLIRREKGVPQGAVVSPLLANLFLDEFDERLLGQGLKLVRYADDFLVLCKSREEAERALDKVREAAADEGLNLNEAKTQIVDFEHGFTYLGYLFCRSVVLDKGKAKDEQAPAAPHALPAWALPGAAARIEPDGGFVENAPPPERDDLHLTISGGDKSLHFVDGRLQIRDVDGDDTEMPWHGVKSISCLGRVRLSPAAMHACLRDGVPVTFADSQGNLLGMLSPAAGMAPDAVVAQVLFAESMENRLDVAREIVGAKIHNQNVTVRRQDGELDEALTLLERRASSAGSLKTLLGLEGQAAAVYFRRFARWTAPFEFPGRQRRPAKEPVNAMLNLAYSLLYKQAAIALTGAKLLPGIGLFHTRRNDYSALAADLMEEFRFLADALVLATIHRGQIVPGDFSYPEKGFYPCLMRREARNLLLGTFEERLSGEVALLDKDKRTYRRWLEHQADALYDRITGALAFYQAIRIR